MSDFHKFAKAVHEQFVRMSAGELYTTNVEGRRISDEYLAAFPAGSNPIFRTNTEHDCSCCKQFLRNIGNVVAIGPDGALTSVWDAPGLEFPYDEVAARLNAVVKAHFVDGLFRPSEPSYGAETSRELGADSAVTTWYHFHGKIAARHSKGRNADKERGYYATVAGVFKRGLEELKADALSTALELIDSNSLYRGAEHRAALVAFSEMHAKYAKLAGIADRNNFVWVNAGSHAARFRNTAIGTLIIDLSDGVDLERAVKSFEDKVSGTNYKRPTALVTPGMIATAMKTINELGLEPALERRMARLSDISVNNVLWVDGSVQGAMKGGIEGLLLDAVKAAPASADHAEDISIDDFMHRVLPTIQSLELMVKNSHQGNFMSLTASVHADVAEMFKWSNNFGWSYDGNITDSIKERVKAAGGTTDAVMRTSLAWFNHDDLDIHAFEPNGNRIYFGNKGRRSAGNGGVLDVDMNAGHGTTRAPVENIVWHTPGDGVYRIAVNNYSRRETSDTGFTLEVENAGVVHQFTSRTSPQTSGTVMALDLTVKDRVITAIKPDSSLTGGSFSQEKWGVATETFTKVNTVMFSPNYWDDNAVGNKHWFFLLSGCKNPLPARGIYNEFLKSGLDAHRKVFELLGEKTKCQPTDDQLSGVGFSSTKGDKVLVRVTGAKIRKTYNINF